MARLRLNVAKTKFFVSGLVEDKAVMIQEAAEFKRGCFPVRYLGVPLVTRKLTNKDCLPLLERERVPYAEGTCSKESSPGSPLVVGRNERQAQLRFDCNGSDSIRVLVQPIREGKVWVLLRGSNLEDDNEECWEDEALRHEIKCICCRKSRAFEGGGSEH
ncbi:hypothetical protein F3Y22_tig00109926pilonHSYRG00115 [Hibiscus syriacus]|uniref:Uncharacterized protein n=1 Tax=Hibiscus syriacus TaxID=106335 RepID=A0A6A3BSS1_HIBSY|nr:hypothetical protein F3Y22_tig00109926pilonHSYRG00115 [Hibiscus syriacus]